MRRLLLVPLVFASFACKPEAPRTSDAQVPPAAGSSSASTTLSYDTSCRADDDCAPAPGCCPTPCTSLVVNVKELPRVQASLASCDRSAPCPSAGGCRTHAYLCNGGRCALVYAGEPGYRERR
ncbi:MAG: hypothetical protein HOO96_40305 [Polyangiaceae bacterium]|nr:hypothetical protein [Polyangiaceae bacterium]